MVSIQCVTIGWNIVVMQRGIPCRRVLSQPDEFTRFHATVLSTLPKAQKANGNTRRKVVLYNFQCGQVVGTRMCGYSYARIPQTHGLPINTIKATVKRLST